MHKFPSIEQYRNAIRNVKYRASYVGRDENDEPIYDSTRPIPTLKYRGTVKLHGTNAGIYYDSKGVGEFQYQSRERVLSLQFDNAGFMLYMMSQFTQLSNMIDEIYRKIGYSGVEDDCPSVAIYGEWCGNGIQKGVAISELDKMFVYFAIRLIWEKDGETESQWLDVANFTHLEYPESRIFNIMNFNHPELAQNRMVEITEEVEKECPVGAKFGVHGVGEGIVWQCITPEWYSSDFWFKVKGEKHSVSKVKTLAPVDTVAHENLHSFVNSVVTEQRLEQGLQNLLNEQLKLFEMQSLGDFIRWVVNDIMKEESDTIVANQIDPKKLGGPVASIARQWYIKRLNSNGQ